MTIEETIVLIKRLHDGQTYDGDQPYWTHPVEVMNHLPEMANVEDRLIALLHDVGEDCSDEDWDVARSLIVGFSEYIQRGVLLLTRINGQFLHYETMLLVSGTYMDYIQNIAHSNHYGAIVVKLTDNLRNSDPERIARVVDPEERARLTNMAEKRYARARAILEPASITVTGMRLVREMSATIDGLK